METSRIQQALENAKMTLENAKDHFSKGKLELEIKASKSIDLFGTTALQEVSDIAHTTKGLMEKLYVTCQTQIKILDEICRPLLNDEVLAAEVRGIWEMIRTLNEESEISVDFSASLNCANLGDLAIITYNPSIDSKMIESYWESTYKGWNGRKELEEEENRKKKEEEEQRKEARKKTQNKEEEEYKRQLAKIEEIETEVKKEREKMLNELLTNERETLEKRIESDFLIKKKEFTKLQESCLNERSKREENLSGISVLNFIKRRQYNKTIKKLTEQIEYAQQQLREAQITYESEKGKIDTIISRKKATFDSTVKTKYPMPRRPRQPLSMRVKNPSAYELACDGAKNEILNILEKNGECSILSLSSSLGFSYKKTMELAKDLQKEGEIKIREKKPANSIPESMIREPHCKLIER